MLGCPAKSLIGSQLSQQHSPTLSGHTAASTVREKMPAGIRCSGHFCNQELNPKLNRFKLHDKFRFYKGQYLKTSGIITAQARFLIRGFSLSLVSSLKESWLSFQVLKLLKCNFVDRQKWTGLSPQDLDPKYIISFYLSRCDSPLWFMLQGAVSGSVQASDRLMKELREIYRSQSYKTGDYNDTFSYSGDFYCFHISPADWSKALCLCRSFHRYLFSRTSQRQPLWMACQVKDVSSHIQFLLKLSSFANTVVHCVFC